MAAKTIVLCFPLTEGDVATVQAVEPESKLIVSDQDRIAEDIFSADIFCGHAKVPVDWQAVVAQGKLKWIQSSAAGLDHCLVPPVLESDISVSGCSGLFANQVAEQTLALLYACVRRLPVFYQLQGRREYVRQATDDLHGKTVSIVGFGGNGRRIAALLQHIAGKIIATDCFPDFEPPESVELLPANEINALFERGDVVIVTLPLTDATNRCIGAEQFSRLPRGSYFINVARGQVVDHKALYEAIVTERVAFAGLDVFDPEPPQTDDPFWEHDRVLLTPHVGAQSAQRVPSTVELFCENMKRFRQRRPLINLVDKTLQFPRPEHRPVQDARGRILYPKI